MSSPGLSVVLETAHWFPTYRVQLWDSLVALFDQASGLDDVEILVVLMPEHHEYGAALRRKYPDIQILEAPEALNDYGLKNLGFSRINGEIVAFTNANCIPGDRWIEQIRSFFAQAEPQMVALQGRTRFVRGPLSRLWDAVWWSQGLQSRGEIESLYTDNNVALVAGQFEDGLFDPAWSLRTAFEGALSNRIHEQGNAIAFEPDMKVEYHYHPSLRVWWEIAVDRGYYQLPAWRTASTPQRRFLYRIRWLTPLLVPPLLWFRDLVVLGRRWSQLGFLKRELWKYPGYALVLLLHLPGVSLGLLKGLLGRPEPPRPL